MKEKTINLKKICIIVTASCLILLTLFIVKTTVNSSNNNSESDYLAEGYTYESEGSKVKTDKPDTNISEETSNVQVETSIYTP